MTHNNEPTPTHIAPILSAETIMQLAQHLELKLTPERSAIIGAVVSHIRGVIGTLNTLELNEQCSPAFQIPITKSDAVDTRVKHTLHEEIAR